MKTVGGARMSGVRLREGFSGGELEQLGTGGGCAHQRFPEFAFLIGCGCPLGPAVGVERGVEPVEATDMVGIVAFGLFVGSYLSWKCGLKLIVGSEVRFDDGQTVVFAPTQTVIKTTPKGESVTTMHRQGSPRSQRQQTPGQLLVFTTPTIIDPAGSPAHAPGREPFPTDKVPPQPAE